jgi:hypothetical protein
MNTNAKRLLHIFLSAGKSLWTATMSMAWGLASIFLLAALIAYYKQDSSAILNLLDIAHWLMQNWGLFWVIIFFFDFLVNVKELGKNEPMEEIDYFAGPSKKEERL